MPTTPNEVASGMINKLSQLVSVVNQDVKTIIIIFLLLRMYQVEGRTDKRTIEQDKRALEAEIFNRKQLEKFNEQEDRRIRIRETELNIKYATDTIK